MAVITISREFGSAGIHIGKQVAKVLGYNFVDKTTLEKVLQQYGLIQLNDLYKSAPGFWASIDERNLLLISMLNKSFLALARRGNVVILGRGGFAALSGYADVLHVRIQAPFPVRVQRIMEREGIPDLQRGQDLVKENDKARMAFLQSFYNARWDATNAFNLVINTHTTPPDMAAQWIITAAKNLEQQNLDRELTTAKIEVDSIMAITITEILTDS
jgi:cytidylate kinase